MKEATGELSGTVITVVAIAAVAAIVTAFILPNFTRTLKCRSVDESCFARCTTQYCQCDVVKKEGDSETIESIQCPNPNYQ